MNNFKSIEELAVILYENGMDMDGMDYEEEKEQTISELQEALEQIKSIAQNEYNKDYWRTFWNALQYQK